MKKCYSLFPSRLSLITLALSLVFIASFAQAQDNNGNVSSPEQTLLQEGLLFSQIRIVMKEDLPFTVEPGKNYSITWTIEGLRESQRMEETCLHWAYLSKLNNKKEMEDYKCYPYRGKSFTATQDEYSDNLYLYFTDIVPPVVMVIIHAKIEGKEIILGPTLMDINIKD